MKTYCALSFFLLSVCLSGCKHTSSLTPMYLSGPEGSGSENAAAMSECGWVQVSESKTKLFSSTVRQFDDALFYCCPTEEGKAPECREAKWLERD